MNNTFFNPSLVGLGDSLSKTGRIWADVQYQAEHSLANCQVLLWDLKTAGFGERVFACRLSHAPESHFPGCQQGQEDYNVHVLFSDS